MNGQNFRWANQTTLHNMSRTVHCIWFSFLFFIQSCIFFIQILQNKELITYKKLHVQLQAKIKISLFYFESLMALIKWASIENITNQSLSMSMWGAIKLLSVLGSKPLVYNYLLHVHLNALITLHKYSHTRIQISRVQYSQLCLIQIHWDWRNSFNFNRENLTYVGSKTIDNKEKRIWIWPLN